MGAAVSSSHIVSTAPCPSGGGLLILFPCSSLKVPLTGDSSPLAAPMWVLPTGCSPSGTGCSSMGPPQGHKPCQQTCSGMGSSLHGSTDPGRSLLQRRAPHRVTSSFRHPPVLVWGPVHGLQVEICSTMDLRGLQGHSLPHHGLQHELQRKTFCSSVSSTSSLSFFTDLGVCRVVSFTLSHSSLSTAVSQQFFFPLLEYVIPEVYHCCWLAWPWAAVGPS